MLIFSSHWQRHQNNCFYALYTVFREVIHLFFRIFLSVWTNFMKLSTNIHKWICQLMIIWFWQNRLNILCAVMELTFFCKNHYSDVFWRQTFNSILQKNKALRSTSHNQTLSRKEMNIKLNAAYYKISGIMQDRVYACKITGVDGTQATHLWRMGQDWSAADWQCQKTVA